VSSKADGMASLI